MKRVARPNYREQDKGDGCHSCKDRRGDLLVETGQYNNDTEEKGYKDERHHDFSTDDIGFVEEHVWHGWFSLTNFYIHHTTAR